MLGLLTRTAANLPISDVRDLAGGYQKRPFRLRPIADVPQYVHNASMTPDRYEWLHAEQKTIATEGSEVRRAWRMYRHMTVGAFIVTAILLGMLAVVGLFPRDPNGAMQLRYLAPACLVIAFGSAAILWKWRTRHLSVRFAAWVLLCFAALVLTIGMLP